MTRTRALAAAVLLALALPACGGENADGAEPLAGRPGTPQQGLDACFDGDVALGLGRVDAAAEGGDPDALTARAMCRWLAFAADSAAADAQAALADYDRAIERSQAAPSATPTDHLVAQRAFARLMTDADGWGAVIDGLDEAVGLAPGSARHVLDRAFVHLAARDTAAAIADLERVLLVDATDTLRVTLAQQTLGELTGVPLDRFFQRQETVVF